jgi:hypothetical protein
MQSILRSCLSSPLLNKLLNDPQLFVVATGLESAGVVKNVSGIIGEHKFIVDVVLTRLVPGLGTAAGKGKYGCH